MFDDEECRGDLSQYYLNYEDSSYAFPQLHTDF